MTRKYTRWIEESADALTHGAWQLDPKTRVLVWVADPTPIKRDRQPIACPTCNTTADRACLTRGGFPRRDHPQREIPKSCRDCGRVLDVRRRHVCDNCVTADGKKSRDRRADERVAA